MRGTLETLTLLFALAGWHVPRLAPSPRGLVRKPYGVIPIDLFAVTGHAKYVKPSRPKIG